MEPDGLRLIIRRKIADGQLPEKSQRRLWGRQGKGHVCDACDGAIMKDEFVLGGVYIIDQKETLQFHVQCFWIWDSEVRASAPADAVSAIECVYCHRLISSDQDRTTIQHARYHAACWTEKERER